MHPIQNPDAAASFESLFKAHFNGLHAYAATILKNEDTAEDVVQNTFLKLRKAWKSHSLPGSPAAYLYRSVYNESLNILKHQKVKTAHEQYTLHTEAADTTASGASHLRELEARLDEALRDLPEQCRTIFQLSRFEELKYREIADRLGLSIKTIEAQMERRCAYSG